MSPQANAVPTREEQPLLSPVPGTRTLLQITPRYYNKYAIAGLASHFFCVFEDSLLEDLALDLAPHPHIEAVAIVDRGGNPRGIVRRKEVHGLLSRPYAWEVFKKTSVQEALEEAPCIPHETHYLSVFSDAKEAIYLPEPTYYVLVDDAHRFAGIVSTQDILIHSYRHIMQDLALAAHIQERIHPSEQTIHRPGFSALTFSSMSQGIGGDYLNVREYKPGMWLMFMGDVSGKGISASLVASLIDGIFRTYKDSRGPSGLLAYLNAYLHHLFALEKFLTALLVVIHEGKPVITLYDMGHSYLFLIRNGEIKRLKTHESNLPLGIHPDLSPVGNTITLMPGDVLFAHTDGLIEQHNREGATFSYAHIQRAVSRWDGVSLESLKERILSEYQTFKGEHPQEDDVTFFLLSI